VLIDAGFRELAETAKANIGRAEEDARKASGFCLTHSPSMSLVLQFGAPLLVHPYVLLGTLELRDSYYFDISKLAMKH